MQLLCCNKGKRSNISNLSHIRS